jgi:hypothetical protein
MEATSEPRISVVIATFNRADLLCHAIDSALAQDCPAEWYEVIVVDDGSTDSTRQMVADRYADRVRYLHKANGGVNSAYQFGVAAARGEIVAMLDSDDFWYPDKLSTCVPLFDQAADVVAVVHDLDIYRGDRTRRDGTCWSHHEVALGREPGDALAIYLAGQPLPAWTSATLWRRDALLKIFPIPEGLWGFIDAYCIRNIIFHGRVCGVHRPLGGYLIHASNDYGGRPQVPTPARAERGVREERAMQGAFAERCAQFGRKPSERRILIQKLALGEAELGVLRFKGIASTVRWLLRNELALGVPFRVQLLCNAMLPERLAVFIKNRLLYRFGVVD